jgi:hypothetical protein
MTKRISELPAAGAIADTDEFELNQGGVSRRATRVQIVAGLADATHQHTLADITDSGALAALDSVSTAEIAATAFASQGEAIAGIDNAKIMTPLRTAEAIAAEPPAAHQHTLADITDSGALAALDNVGTAEIDDAAFASQAEAIAGSENSKIMTALRTAEAIAALAPDHQHSLSDITDAGTLAALDLVGAGEIEPNAVTGSKILAGAVGADKLADQAVVESKIASTAVTEAKIASGAVTEGKIASGAVTGAKLADGAVGAGKLQAGIPIDMQDAVLSAPELRDYSESSPTASISAGTLVLDLESGNVFEVALTQNVTALVLANPPAADRAGCCSLIVRQDSTGGRSFAWHDSIKWPGGAPPAITSAAHSVDVFSLITRDGGVTWYGFLGGQDFS